MSGAGGFVGSAVTRRLVSAVEAGGVRFPDGAPVSKVVAVVRPGGSLIRLETLRESPSLSVEDCDMADSAAFERLLRRLRPRTILHLAVDRSANLDQDDSTRRRLIDRPLENMFTALAGTAGARVIHTSSVWVLPAGDRLDETTPPRPLGAYGENKLRAERLLPALQAQTGVDWINLRLFNIFGRYEAPSRLLPYLVDRLSRREVAILGNPDAIRDFTDVDVIAGAYLAALVAGPPACGATYHIGSGRGITIRAFAMTVADVVGHPELIRAGAVETADAHLPCQTANPDRAREILGWSSDTNVLADIRSAARALAERYAGETRVV